VAAKTKSYTIPKHVGLFAELGLVLPFYIVTHDTKKLVALLERMETFPSSVLLEEDALTIPQSLQELFKKMCTVIQKTEAIGLHDGLFLKKFVKQWADLSQQIHGFAVRYEDAQEKLVNRVPAEQVAAYQASFAAYANCRPKASQGVHEDDRDSELLHF